MGQDCSRADNAEDGGGGGNRRRTTKGGKNRAYAAAGDGDDNNSNGGGGGSAANMQKAARRALRRASGEDEDGHAAAASSATADALAVSEGGGGGTNSSVGNGGLQSLSHTSNPLRNFTNGPPGTATTTFTMVSHYNGKPNMALSSSSSSASANLPAPPAPLSTKFREYHSPTFGGAATEGFLSCVSAEGVPPSGYFSATTSPINTNTNPLPPPKKGMVLCAGEDKNIYYCNYETGHVIKTFRKAHSRDVKILTRPVGGTFFSGGRDGLIKQWNLDGGNISSGGGTSAAAADTPVMTYTGHSLIVTALTPLFRDGTASAATSSENSGDVISNNNTKKGGWCGATRLVSGSRDNTVRLWDISTGKCLSTVDVKLNLVHFLHEVGGGGGSLAAGMVAQGGEDLTVRLWDTRLDNHNSLSLVSTMANFDYHPLCAASRGDTPTTSAARGGQGGSPSNNNTLMASHNHMYTGHNGFNGKGSMILEWDLRMQRSTRKFLGHTMSVRCMCFARLALPIDEQTGNETFLAGGEITVLVTASDDGTIKLWNVDSPSAGLAITHTATGTSTPQSTPNQKQFIASISIPEGKVNSIDQSAVSGRLILGMQSGSIIVLDAVQALSIRPHHQQGGGDGDAYDVDVAVGSRLRYFGRPNPDVC